MKFSKLILAFAASLLILSQAGAATIVGNLMDIYGGGIDRTIKISPKSTPQAVIYNGTNYTVMDLAKTVSSTNSVFAVVLLGGIYNVDFGTVNGVATPVTKILVPPYDTNTYSFNYVANLATNLGTFVWTNSYGIAAGTNIVIQTNGALLVINASIPTAAIPTNFNFITVTNKITIDSTGSSDGLFMGTNQMISGSRFYYYGNGNRLATAAGSLYWGAIANALFAGSGGNLYSTNGTEIFDSATTNFTALSYVASGSIFVTNASQIAKSQLNPNGLTLDTSDDANKFVATPYGMTFYSDNLGAAPSLNFDGTTENGLLSLAGNLYVTNHAYDASGSLLDPEANEYVTASFVRSVLNNGQYLYGTTNTIAIGVSNVVNNATNSISLQFGPNPPIGYIKGFTNFSTGTYTNGPYFATIISTNTYQAVTGPFVNDYYIAAGGFSQPAISITPDIFITYNKTNLIPICEGAGQSLLMGGTTNLYTWIQSAAQYNSTNSAGFYVVRRVRVTSQNGNGLYINVLGGNGTATSMSFNTPVTVNANYTGTFTGNGSGLTNIASTNITGLGTAAYSNSTAFAASTVTNLTAGQLATIAAALTNASAFAPSTVTNLTAGQLATIAAAVTNNASPTLTGLSVGAQTALDVNGNGKVGGVGLTNGVLTGNGSGITNVSASLPTGTASLAIGSLTLTNAITIKTNSTIPTLVQNVNTTCIPSSFIDPTSSDGLIILSYLAAAGTTMPPNSNYFTITLSQPATSTNSLIVIPTANVTLPASGQTIAANSSLNRYNVFASSNSFTLASGTSVPPVGMTNQLIYLQVYRR